MVLLEIDSAYVPATKRKRVIAVVLQKCFRDAVFDFLTQLWLIHVSGIRLAQNSRMSCRRRLRGWGWRSNAQWKEVLTI